MEQIQLLDFLCLSGQPLKCAHLSGIEDFWKTEEAPLEVPLDSKVLV